MIDKVFWWILASFRRRGRTNHSAHCAESGKGHSRTNLELKPGLGQVRNRRWVDVDHRNKHTSQELLRPDCLGGGGLGSFLNALACLADCSSQKEGKSIALSDLSNVSVSFGLETIKSG